MRLSCAGLEFIKSFESYHPYTYICPGGYNTIGYGHVLSGGEVFPNGISLFEADRLLWRDVQIAENGVRRLINVPLMQTQFDALVSFAFNLGVGALQRSTMRCKINRQEHHEVPEELMKWVWASGRRLKGLVRRRQAEGIMYQG